MPTPPAPSRALITGASSGIGAALAARLASRGVEVWLAARRLEALEQNVAQILASGGKAHAMKLDVADPDATAAKMVELDESSGGIDLVIANAGVGGERGSIPVSRLGWSDVRCLFDVNLLGALATLQPFVPKMLARGHGHLVGVSSISADLPTPRTAPYGASKAGLTFYLEAADMELRPQGVPVTVIHPGFVRTPMSDELTDPKPLLVELEDAIEIIDRGIQRRERMIRFPWALGALSRAANALPRALTGALIAKATAERPRRLELAHVGL